MMNGTVDSNSNVGTSMSGDSSSDAALCTLHVSVSATDAVNNNIYTNDWVLNLLCQYIQQTTFQLRIIINGTTKSSSSSLSMSIGGGDVPLVIYERNAIVRSLIGIALHGAFDHSHAKQSYNNINGGSDMSSSSSSSHQQQQQNQLIPPICWNGGYSMMNISCHSTSIVASTQHAKILHYMSLATLLRCQSIVSTTGSNNNDTDNMTKMILEELNNALQNTSFLLPYSSTPSFVDLDVCVALLLLLSSSSTVPDEKADAARTFQSTYPIHVQRWMMYMIPFVQQLSIATNVSCPYSNHFVTVMNAIQSFAHHTIATSSPPILFNGTEDMDILLSQLYSSTTKGNEVSRKQKSSTKVASTAAAAPTASSISTDGAIANVVGDGDAKGDAAGGGKKKLTKQDKKAAAAAAKEAAAAGVGTNNAAATTTAAGTKKVAEGTTPADATLYDVMALDIRIGKIIKIWEHESADKLYCEEIDFGNGDIRQIASGLRPFYKKPETELLHQLVLVVYNLKKRTLVGFASHGMVLCASNDDHTMVEIVTPPVGAVLGERITFDGLDTNAVAEAESKVVKKKIFEMMAPDLHTNDDGTVLWKNHAAQCSVGPICAINKMPNAHVS